MKMHQENKELLSAVDFAQSQTSASDFIGDVLAFAVQFNWTGATAATGDLIVEGSIDNVVFIPIDIYGISGETSGARLVNIERAGYSHMRARWVYTSGTGGTITVLLSSKRN